MKILLLNYYWPPCGGPAVQRWLDITNNLSEEGIATSVITVDEQQGTFPFVDHTLLQRVAADTEVHRTDTSELFDFYRKYIGKGKVPATGLVDEPDPNLLQKMARFARGNFFLPDPRRGWNRFAFDKAAEVIRREGIDVVFTAGPPHSTHLVGLRIKQMFPRIKWVADIHDYWTEISYLSKFYRTAVAGWFDRRLERKVLLSADRIMTHCESSVQMQRKKLHSSGVHDQDDKVFAFTMGYNEKLFGSSRGHASPQEFFEIIYTGVIAEHYEPQVFFRALSAARSRRPSIPLKLKFVGSLAAALREDIITAGLKDCLVEESYAPHHEIVEALHRTSATFLINPRFRDEASHVPGKLYEYLAVFKPVISVSPSGSENERIINSMQAGRNFERSDEKGIEDYITELMDKWLKNRTVDLPENQAVRKYGRKAEAHELAIRIRSLKAGADQ